MPELDLERHVKDENTTFLKYRTDAFLNDPDSHTPWTRKSPSKMRTLFNVVVPEDGEDYWEPMSLVKRGDHYALIQVSTGIVRGHSTLSSQDYEPLRELGERIFDS